MNPQRPRLHALPLISLTVGLGLGLYYGELWYRLPSYSEEELRASVELNLAMDLQRQPRGSQASPEDHERLRQQIRQEIEADIRRERQEIRQGLVPAVLMVLFGGAYLAFLIRQRRA